MVEKSRAFGMRLLACVMSVAMAIGMMPALAFAEVAGGAKGALVAAQLTSAELPGSGTASDPYRIANADDWHAFASSVSGGTNGGLIGVIDSGSTNISNSCFNGKLLTISQTKDCGGLVGWKSGNLKLTNCLYDPAALGESETEVLEGTESGTSRSCTFARNGQDDDFENSYYTQTLGVEQGKAR